MNEAGARTVRALDPVWRGLIEREFKPLDVLDPEGGGRPAAIGRVSSCTANSKR
jgi:hypothetical protein